MPVQKLTFIGATGAQLAARIDLPEDTPPVAFALFAHCFTCTKNLKAINAISQALTAAGMAVLRFDFTGLGESEGDANTTFSSNVGDLVAAATYLGQQFAAPALLVGHSLGGAAVLQAAAQIPSVRAVATIGAPCSPSHVIKLLDVDQAQIEATGLAQVTLAGHSFTITKQFLDDLEQQRMEATIHDLRRALLICHAPRDEVVGIDNATRIFVAARHPKSFLSLDDADHFLSQRHDAHYVGTVIAAWASKYIAQPTNEPAEILPDQGHVVVHTGAHGYRTDISARGHRLLADEPLGVGGTNTGPTPYDYVAAGLGACTSITLRMYADRKNWPLHDITVRLQHRKIHAEDCATCETHSGALDQISREIELAGPLNDEQRQRLLEIADKCPVHRTLHGEIDIPTAIKDAQEQGEGV